MKLKRITAAFIIVCMLLSVTVFAQPEYLSRGEVADYLLIAADYYNPGIVREDIIQGYEDGLLHEDKNVTRAEALIMLKRAFGKLPTPKGHNKRVALTAKDFNDVPAWAEEELKVVFNSGIVAGTGKNTFSPDLNITGDQLELFVKRVYALCGENLCDDFYATANKEVLEKTNMNYGQYTNGTLQTLQDDSSIRVSNIISQIVNSNHKQGTPKQKIADLYELFMDVKTLDENSVEPIRKYLDEIDAVKNIGELSLLQEKLSEELCVVPFAGFMLNVDLEDSSKYMLTFENFRPFMYKEFYEEASPEIQSKYKDYIATLLVVSGEEQEDAQKHAEKYFAFEKLMSESMLSTEESSNIEQIYNIYKFNKLETHFPDFNFETELKISGFAKDERILVTDPGLMKKFSGMYNQSNLEVLKIIAKVALMDTWGEFLDRRVIIAAEDFENALYGSEGHFLRSQLAEELIKELMPEYLGQIYAEKYFDEKSKQDVTNMVLDIKEVFKERINGLDWMSDETKARANGKLDSMGINIGYPDRFDSFMDSVEVIPAEKGGTLFSNMLTISKAARKHIGSMQFVERDLSAWAFAPYDVNAGYDPTSNTMTFPAAILQSPIYDNDASYEKNLGGIGFIIAHEMTHAFDINGALFDEKGNICNWWSENDCLEFEKLCTEVEAFYDGYEAVPGISMNGKLTLGENVSDMGAAACIIQLAKKKGDADYREIFLSMAHTFASTSTREYAKYLSQNDSHADYKARINCVVVHIDEFYTAFGVKEGDGMYLAPEERITIW